MILENLRDLNCKFEELAGLDCHFLSRGKMGKGKRKVKKGLNIKCRFTTIIMFHFGCVLNESTSLY